MSGQINRGTVTGEFIYNCCLKEGITTIVEIGTWNGQGSTKCIADAILNRFDDSHLVSLESNQEMYKKAVEFWQQYFLNTNSHLKNKVNLLYGSIVGLKDLIPLEEVRTYPDYSKDWEKWYKEDIENLKKSPNILNVIPNQIDLLLLDGGEFSTLAEFNILKNRSRYILLDDTRTTKCRKVTEYLKNDQNYDVVFDNQHDGRNGFTGFKKNF
jgi:hypothetical protein